VRYVKLEQLHDGVAVVGGELVQVGREGTVRAVLGQLTPDLRLLVEPTLAGDVALRRALSERTEGLACMHVAPSLRVLTAEDAATTLAWRAVFEHNGAAGYAFEEIFVGAHDGTLLSRLSRIYTDINREVYGADALRSLRRRVDERSPHLGRGRRARRT
jgi:hypothetical protein